MNAKKFRNAREKYADNLFVYESDKYRAQVLKDMTDAAKPQHVGEPTVKHSNDYVKCSCGWKSEGYWDGMVYAWDEWRKHVADEMGLLTKKCPCGKEYVPIDGGRACHELRPTRK